MRVFPENMLILLGMLLICWACTGRLINWFVAKRTLPFSFIADIVFFSHSSTQIGIPLKTKKNPKGLFTEKEVHDMFVVLFS